MKYPRFSLARDLQNCRMLGRYMARVGRGWATHNGPYETNELIIHARPTSDVRTPRRAVVISRQRQRANPARCLAWLWREYIRVTSPLHKENTFVAANLAPHTPFVRTVSTDARVMAVINATRVQSKHSASTCRDNVSFATRPVPFPTA